MSYKNDPRNIIGMAEILVNDDEEIDIEQIEKSIINGVSAPKETNVRDIVKEFDKEIESIGKQYGIDSSNEYSSNIKDNDHSRKSGMKLEDDDEERDTDYFAPKFENTKLNFSRDPVVNKSSPSQEKYRFDSPKTIRFDGRGQKNTFDDDYQDKMKDEQLNDLTNEERKQRHISSVFNKIERADEEEIDFLEQQDDEEEIAKIIELIDQLKSHLSSQGVDISRVPDVGINTPKKELKSVLRILQIKNDRLRYCDMFEEGMLSLAYGLERIFDGNREVLGSKIDLTGVSETIKVKLIRMRYDTSTFVSEALRDYNISSGWRILFELLPSIILYSRDRRLHSDDNLNNDKDYRDAMLNLNKK